MGTGYLIAAVLAATDDAAGSWGFVPFAGPFVTIASRDLSCSNMASPSMLAASEECADRVSGQVRVVSLSLVSGLLQLSGATLFVVGTGQSERTLVPEGAWLSPRVGDSSAGVDLVGRF
jgi:hypothetical protein